MATQRYTDAGRRPEDRAPVPCSADRHQLGWEGPRRHRHALDRRSRAALVTRWSGDPRNVAVYAGAGWDSYDGVLLERLLDPLSVGTVWDK
jgi:hypothetical protein